MYIYLEKQLVIGLNYAFVFYIRQQEKPNDEEVEKSEELNGDLADDDEIENENEEVMISYL